MSEPRVINALPVILLAKAGLMECVSSLAETFVIPEPVADEIFSVRARMRRRGGKSNCAIRQIEGSGEARRQICENHDADRSFRGHALRPMKPRNGHFRPVTPPELP